MPSAAKLPSYFPGELDGTLKVTPAGIDPDESVVVDATCVLPKLIVTLWEGIKLEPVTVTVVPDYTARRTNRKR